MTTKKPLPEPLTDAAAVIKRMLAMPPKPHDQMTQKKPTKKSKSRKK